MCKVYIGSLYRLCSFNSYWKFSPATSVQSILEADTIFKIRMWHTD